MKLVLRRIDMSDKGVFGHIFDDDGKIIAATCERPDNGNKPMGCIPVGIYKVTQFDSPRMGRDFLLHDVPGRAMVEIHAGNTIKDTEGCILIGTGFSQIEYGEDKGVRAVIYSRSTLATMLKTYPDGFDLEIMEDI